MTYQTVSQECPKCKEQVSLFSESQVHVGQKYSFICPYCNEQSAFVGSISIPAKEPPENGVRFRIA
jgi:hypothetical protein